MTTCVIRAPLPYSLRFSVTIDRVEPAALIETTIDGDIAGPASLTIEPHRTGSRARLNWSLAVRSRLLQSGAIVARPLMHWGHEWVVANGVDQFRRHLRASTAAAETPNAT